MANIGSGLAALLSSIAGSVGDYASTRARSKDDLLNSLVKMKMQQLIDQSDPYKQSMAKYYEALAQNPRTGSTSDISKILPLAVEAKKQDIAERSTLAGDIQRKQLMDLYGGATPSEKIANTPIQSIQDIIAKEPTKLEALMTSTPQGEVSKYGRDLIMGLAEKQTGTSPKAPQKDYIQEEILKNKLSQLDSINKAVMKSGSNEYPPIYFKTLKETVKLLGMDKAIEYGLIDDESDYEALQQY